MLKFILGVFVGSIFGVITMILAAAAKQADIELENMQKREEINNDKESM